MAESSFKSEISSLWHHQQRKEELKAELETTIKPLLDKLHQTNKKIKEYQRRIKRMKEREEKVRFVVQHIKEFFGVSPIGRSTSPKAVLGRWIICKYLLEKKMEGPSIEQVLHISPGYAAKNRLKLTRSFATNPSNKRYWDDFIMYFNGILKENDVASPSNNLRGIAKMSKLVTPKR